MTEASAPASPETGQPRGRVGQRLDAGPTGRGRTADLRWGVFGLLLFGLVWTHQRFFEAPTPVSRLDLLRAVVLHGEVHIDRYHTNTLDKAVWGGHFYSDKAPGTVVLALPGFAIAAAVVSLLGLHVDAGPGALVCSWVASASSNGLLAAAGGVALWLWLELPCALGLERFPKLGAVLAVWSIGVTTVATLTDACPWPEIANPLVELHLPRLLRGELSPNLGLALGLGPHASVAVCYALLAGGLAWLWHRLPAGPDSAGAAASGRPGRPSQSRPVG